MKHFTQANSDVATFQTGLYLAAVAQVIRLYGFDKQATAERAARLTIEAQENAEAIEVQDFVVAGNALVRVLETPPTSSFGYDLLAAVQKDVLTARDLKLVAYAVKGYWDVKDVKTGAHIGAIKQRMELVVTVLSSEEKDSEWGTSYQTKAVTEDGNAVLWYAKEQQAGVRHIKGTVTKHTDFNGVKTTHLNRVSLV